jgi:ABC-type taurine transport system substrate-binding protein
MAIWKKTMTKIGPKKVAGLDVNKEKTAVKTVDKARRFHRGSLHFSEALTTGPVLLKPNDKGKLELNATLEMP